MLLLLLLFLIRFRPRGLFGGVILFAELFSRKHAGLIKNNSLLIGAANFLKDLIIVSIDIALALIEHLSLAYTIDESDHDIEAMPVIQLPVTDVVVPFSGGFAKTMIDLCLGFADTPVNQIRANQESAGKKQERSRFHRAFNQG